MLNEREKQITPEEKIDAQKFLELVQKLPEKEQERFFYRMEGVALMCEAERSG